MDDPWDVKSVRQSGQYISCMKIYGVPLLPPVLSRGCREEMQLYKHLAIEVEKHIAYLQANIINSDTESNDDKTDAPELPECEQNYEEPKVIPPIFNVSLNKTEIGNEKEIDNNVGDSPKHVSHFFNSLTSNATVIDTDTPQLTTDYSLSEASKIVVDVNKSPPGASSPNDLPERDYNCLQNEKKINPEPSLRDKIAEDFVLFNTTKSSLSDPFPSMLSNQDGPSSLSSKSFTGSLNDLHTDSVKESRIIPKMSRQRSYTLLKPSPQLLAHLEVQSLNTGVEMSCISMSESLSNLSTPNKKRRSWDLESAKVKWSSMALELKQKNVAKAVNNNGSPKNQGSKSTVKKSLLSSPPRARSLMSDRARRNSTSANTKTLPRSEPVSKPRKAVSPIRNVLSSKTIVKEPTSPIIAAHKKLQESPIPVPLISESEDPATRVRELYEKIQKQQLLQMASLVEKQKREQLLLQQVFEEQNNMLFKQLKSITPRSPVEVKDAWVDSTQEVDRGPVSLSQLISHRSPDQSPFDSPVSTTLTETNNYIHHCDNVLKKSRDISESIKKQAKSQSQNGTKIQSPRYQPEGSRTRTHSPTRSSPASRKLNYDTSASSDREYEPILTDRTNDTMADLNVTFPSDPSDDCHSFNNNTIKNHLCGKEVTVIHASPVSSSTLRCGSTDAAIRSVEKSIHSSMASSRCAKQKVMNYQPTAKELGAATKIVAYAKGYLVRRLMRTERVQATVQTIKDALLCALQLHQDREGIRGADVDLHRRLIQQITAACYSLHDTFVASSASQRCGMIAADRGRRLSLAAKLCPKPFRQTDI